jgi:D-hexose-6-phosphate mutarotase
MRGMGLADLVRAALPASVRVSERGGLPHLDVRTASATAQVFFHGAHIAQWTPAPLTESVLWMSRHALFQRDKGIRGGVPVCFPWFGAHPTGANAPQHGFARLVDWMLVDAGETDGAVTLAFELRGKSFPNWPHSFLITHRLTIGSTLTMALDVENKGHAPFTFEEALHTYYAVGDVTRASVAGLEDTDYLDQVQGFARCHQPREPIRFTGETDRVYLDTAGTCRIVDSARSRTIAVDKSDSRSTVVWNPWSTGAKRFPDFGADEWREMVCVETANVRDAAIRLEPGARHTMTARISIGGL